MKNKCQAIGCGASCGKQDDGVWCVRHRKILRGLDKRLCDETELEQRGTARWIALIRQAQETIKSADQHVDQQTEMFHVDS